MREREGEREREREGQYLVWGFRTLYFVFSLLAAAREAQLKRYGQFVDQHAQRLDRMTATAAGGGGSGGVGGGVGDNGGHTGDAVAAAGSCVVPALLPYAEPKELTVKHY